jgi:dipeptidyl aminopeptidase/acylaminoacyl peptidase
MTSDRSEYVTQIWLASTDGKQNLQITFGEKSSTNPRWSPDGNSIVFTSNRKDNRNNLYLLRLDGGEAEALTDLKSSVTNFDWSPDGQWIAFTMTDPKTDEEEKNDKAKNDFRWVDENIKMTRLYLIPMQKDANGKREPRKLTTENYNVGNFDWAPDGTRIMFSHTKTPVANDWTTADVSVVEVASGKATVFANTPAAEDSPTYSPDGKWVAMQVTDNPPRWAQSAVIQIYSVAGGRPKHSPPRTTADRESPAGQRTASVSISAKRKGRERKSIRSTLRRTLSRKSKRHKLSTAPSILISQARCSDLFVKPRTLRVKRSWRLWPAFRRFKSAKPMLI